eukprot:GHVN01078143.1.p1 GENE.GHVN01078143.1~~GHVN01078143.1.p1  ORF type:complete len:153 (+),score=10.37 GHVN01078143.1:2-460(+)
MARMYSKGRGKSRSIKPQDRRYVKTHHISDEAIIKKTCDLSRKGYKPSQIGLLLRDQHAVGCIKTILGTNINEILRENGLNSNIPEDLYFLIKKACGIRTHMVTNLQDKSAKRQLELTESKIRRLARHYKETKRIEGTWSYDPKTAASLIIN